MGLFSRIKQSSVEARNRLWKHKIISSKKELKNWLVYEKTKYGIKGLNSILTFTEKGTIWHFQKRLRKTEYLINSGHVLRGAFSSILLTRLKIKTGFNIPINSCGKGLKLMHLGSVLINGNSDIGEDCSIHINTSIVAGGRNNGAPIIGNHCVIGVGAVILGGGY